MPSVLRRTARMVLVVALFASLLPMAAAQAEVPHVLVYSGTYGFRHDSIQKGNDTLQALADSTGAFTVEFSEIPLDLAADKLRTVDMVLFNSSTGRFPLTADQRSTLERYWGCGGGWAGIHASADANYGWAGWAEVVGAQFDSHPVGAGAGDVRIVVENADHPVNAAYADMEDWTHGDELYRWIRDVRGTQDVVPLLSLDEDSINPGIQAGSTPYVHHQPLSWVKTFRNRGRVYYNNFGHNQATWDKPEFQQSVVNGVSWVGEVRLDEACFDGSDPLPPAPSAPTPDPLDPQNPREACVLEDNQMVLTPAGLTYAGSHAAVPAYFSKTLKEVVLDLSGTTQLSADLLITHEWPNRVDDYDLSVSTPWGFAGSDNIQPIADPVEQAVVPGVTHCATLDISLFNHAAATFSPGTVIIEVNAAPAGPTDVRLPALPVAATVLAPPGGVTTGFVSPNLVITQGSSLTLTNADTVPHSIVCVDKDAKRLPICQSGLAATAGGTSAVRSIESLPPGTYAYFCGLHPSMVGELTIV